MFFVVFVLLFYIKDHKRACDSICIKIKFFVILLVLCMLYNLYTYQNYILITILFFAIGLLFYNDPEVLDKASNEKKKVKQIIEGFDIENIASNVYTVDKIPKTFKYIFIKSTILQNLINLRFAQKFNQETYIKIFILLEKFLKLFYKAIIGYKDKNTTVESMIQMHLEMKKYKDELKLNVPLVSNHIKRFGNQTLHEVIHQNMRDIEAFMSNKIKILKSSLID